MKSRLPGAHRFMVTSGFFLAWILSPFLANVLIASPSDNAGEGLILWREGRCEVVDPKNLQEAFEAYLSQPEISNTAAQNRSDLLKKASQLLGPAIATPEDLGKAYETLRQLALDPLDEGRCKELLLTLERIANLYFRKNDPKSAESNLRRQKEILSWNIEVRKDHGVVATPTPSLEKGKPQSSASPQSLEAQQLSEVLTEIKRLELGGEVSELQVRLELQDLALRFLERGDYAEAILAARFYRGVFMEKNVPLRIDSDAKLKLAPAGSSPDLSDLENLAAQSLNNIREELANASLLLESRKIVEASRRLATAFAQGSRTLDVLSYSEESKGKVLRQLEAEKKLKKLLIEKDYESALAELNSIEGDCIDFSGKETRATIESAKTLSSVSLAAARQAGHNGQTAVMLEKLKQASDFWPKNPLLPSVMAELQASASIQQATTEEFDHLYAAHKVEEIARGKERFEATFSSQPIRHIKLLIALEEARNIKEGMERAQQLRDFGSLVGSWEIAENLCRRYPEQEGLKKFRASMVLGVEALSRGLESAHRLEGREPAVALANYLHLQRLYPQSGFAAEGVNRLTEKLLEPASSE